MHLFGLVSIIIAEDVTGTVILYENFTILSWGLYFLTKVYHRRDQNKTFRAIQGRSSSRYLIKRALRPLVESDEPENLCSSRKTKNKNKQALLCIT